MVRDWSSLYFKVVATHASAVVIFFRRAIVARTMRMDAATASKKQTTASATPMAIMSASPILGILQVQSLQGPEGDRGPGVQTTRSLGPNTAHTRTYVYVQLERFYFFFNIETSPNGSTLRLAPLFPLPPTANRSFPFVAVTRTTNPRSV